MNKLRVCGFGACMISGFPFSEDFSFFSVGLAESKYSNQIDLVFNLSLPGFPITRVSKYVKRRIVGKTDVVVLQFASTDAASPLGQSNGSSRYATVSRNLNKNLTSPTMLTKIRWMLSSVFSIVKQPNSFTALDDYSSALQDLIDQFILNDICVIVVGPFVRGNIYADKLSGQFNQRINDVVLKSGDVYFVDAYSCLQGYSKSETLLSDGFHLSKQGHAIVGKKVSSLIDEIFVRRNSL